MGRPKYTYNYDHDTDTTTVISAQKINGKVVTTTKTVEGNQTPQNTFLPTTTQSKIVLGILVVVLLNSLLTTMPQLVVTPTAVFGALKLTKNKKTNEKVIAGVGAGALSLIACSIFFKPPTPAPTTYRTNYTGKSSRSVMTTENGDTILCNTVEKYCRVNGGKRIYVK